MISKNTFLFLWLLFITTTLLVSCSINGKLPNAFDNSASDGINIVSKDITDANNKVKNSGDIIKKEANSIEGNVINIRSSIPEDVKAKVHDPLENIYKSAGIIKGQAGELEIARVLLSKSQSDLISIASKIKEIEKQAQNILNDKIKVEKERDEAILREQDATSKMIRWLIVICVMGVGLSVPLGIFGSPYAGMALGASSLTIMIVAITVNAYFDYIAIAGIILIGLTVAMLIYKMFIKDKAIKEVVQTVEAAKQQLPTEERKKIFGDGAVPGLAFQMQSSSTEKVVQGVRLRMKNMWEETISGSRKK